VGVQPAGSDQHAERRATSTCLVRGRWKTRALRRQRHSSTTGLCTCRIRAASFKALDAATGDLLWEYRPEREKVSEGAGGDGNGVQRNIAIYEDKIFGNDE